MISGTNSNSSSPTVSSLKASDWFDIAWQQLIPPVSGPPTVAIWTCGMDGSGNSITPIQLSPSSMKVNSHVSIVSLPDGPRIGWIADYSGTGDPMQTKAVECNGYWPGYYSSYYYSCKSISINKSDDESNFYFTFSAIFSTPGWNNYDFVVSGNNLSTWTTTNGANSSAMYVMAYNNAAAPYYFQTSNSLGSTGLSKEASSQPNSLVQSRGVAVENNGAGLYYSLGNIAVDGNAVDFVDIQDTIKQISNVKTSVARSIIKNVPARKSVTDVNTVLLSKPFAINENSKLTFSDFVEVGDSVAAASVLGSKGYITFTAELIDAGTGRVLGKIKESIYTKAALQSKKATSYTLDKVNVNSNQARVKITAVSNIDSLTFTIINQYEDHASSAIALNGTMPENLALDKSGIVTDMNFVQNYPNPFNPTTTITFSVGAYSHTSLRVYDILGREVATLVDGMKEAGTYTATFDGSRFASGMYFARFIVNPSNGKPIVQVKKMLMLK
jgi:hypothetical protein